MVQLDDITVKPLHGLAPDHIPIFPRKDSFSVKVKDKKSISVNRCHFPIVPLFACTAHKSQGMTLDRAIVDLVPPIRKGRSKPNSVGIEFAYVPLSRVRRLEDLTILRMFDPSVLKVQVNESCFAMWKSSDREICVKICK